MGKRQRSHTSEEADGTCKGKKHSSEHGRPASAITSPLFAVSESSQSDNEVDIVWGHSPPPLNLNLHTTPGPKTRRKSDYTNKDIADMIECIHSRNSSQQSPTISTPPLLGLWMQGRQDVETTPAGAKGQRMSRRLPSRKPSNEAWASLAKDLHMLAEASKDFPCSQQPAAPPEVESEDITACHTNENHHKNGEPECQVDSSVTPKRCPPNQGDAAKDNSPMAELWGDDSWFETESVLCIATQLEEQEASKQLEGIGINPHRTARGNTIPQSIGSSCRNFETSKDESPINKGLKQAVRNTNASSSGHSKHQFTSPPNCRRLSTKQMFQSSSECNLKKENPTKGRASFRLTVPNGSSGLKREELKQFSKQRICLKEANSLNLDKGVNTQSKEASSVIIRGKSQFTKSSNHDSSGTNTLPETSSLGLATNFKKVDATSTGITNSSKIFEPVEEVLNDCNESMDLFESSLVDEEVERNVLVQEDRRRNGDHLNFQNAAKGAVPLDKANNLVSDISSDLSFIDEELLAAVEKEEMHWEEVSSQQVEVVKTSKTSCRDKGLGYHDSFAIPHPIKNAGITATGSALNQTAAPITHKRLQSSQFSFKSSQNNSTKGVKQVMKDQTSAKNIDISLSSEQVKPPVSGIVSHNNRMNQSAGKHVNQFSVATGNKKVGKQFERNNTTQFSTSQTVQFQSNKSAAKMENSSSIHKEKVMPITSNDRVSTPTLSFSPFKAPVSSQFVKSSTSGSFKDSVSRTGDISSIALSEKGIVSDTQIKQQAVKLTKSLNDSVSLAKKGNPATTGTPTKHPMVGSVGEKVPETVSETVSSNGGNNVVLPHKGSRDTFQLGGNLPERKRDGQTKSAHLSQFSSGCKDTKSEKTSNSNVTYSRISLKDENKSDSSSISRNPEVKSSSQFQTKPCHTNTHSVNQGTSNSDLNSSAFSHVSSQFSSSSQVKCNNDTCSEVTPSPIFTTNTVRPPVIEKNGTVPQPPQTGTSWSVFNGHSTDHARSLSRKGKEKGTFSAGTLNSRKVHLNQFSQFSKAKKEQSMLVDPSEEESFLTSGDVLKKEGSVGNFLGTKERLQEPMLESHSALSNASYMSKDLKIPLQFVKTGNAQFQSSLPAITTKSVLTTVTNVCTNDGKRPVVHGYAKQFAKVSRTSSAPSNEGLVSFPKDKIEDTEPRKDCDLKSNQKAGIKVNLNTTVKTLQGNSTESVVKPQNQLLQPRTNIVTIIPSQDKRPCSQEQIEQKRRVALARKKQRENLTGNHRMNLRERTLVKK